MTWSPTRISAAGGGLVIALMMVAAAPGAGARYGEKLAIEDMQPIVIEQPKIRKGGIGFVLMKIVRSW
ncbi:hypothetical protein [Mesorhizobium sp. A623]